MNLGEGMQQLDLEPLVEPVRPSRPWNLPDYLAEFEDCKLEFDRTYPGGRARDRGGREEPLFLLAHWDEFRLAWLASHPWHDRLAVRNAANAERADALPLFAEMPLT